MAGYKSIVPNININTDSGQLRTELNNTFSRLDSQLVSAPYRLTSFNGPSGNTATAETTLTSYTVNFGTLTKQGSSLLLFASGRTAANANNKQVRVYFGSTVIFNTGMFAGNNIAWALHGEIVRNGASSQLTYISWVGSATLPTAVGVAIATESLAINNLLKITGTGTTSDDVSLYTFRVLLST